VRRRNIACSALIDTGVSKALKYRVFRDPQAPNNHEANVSTLEDAPQAHARLSRADEDEGGPSGHQRPQSERQGATGRLTGPVTPGGESDSRAGRVLPRRWQVLRKPAEFEAVLRAGPRFTSHNFTLRAGANERLYARLGIIAGRKSARRAVDRNRARRLIREAFRAAAERLRGYDVVIQLRGDLRGEQNPAVRQELDRLLERLVRRASPSADKPA
jgi:ribonuclease P protein component